MTITEQLKAYDEGFKAYFSDNEEVSNPYDDEDLRDEWNYGYAAAQRTYKNGL